MKTDARISQWSGIILVAACLLATPLLAADEILLNSDFAKDTENWSGDFSNDPAEDNPLVPHSTGQISLDLRERRVVRIFQAFNADTGKLVCNVNFTLTNGGAYTGEAMVSDVASDVKVDQYSSSNYDANTGVLTLYSNSNYTTYQTGFRTPVIILADPDDSRVLLYPLGNRAGGNWTSGNQGNGSAPTTPPNDPAGTSYTVHATIRPHRSYRLYLAFPPGSGSVTITKISLQPDTGQSPPPPAAAAAPSSNQPPIPVVTPQSHLPPAPVVAPSQ
jgi:hypothetical protein